MHALYSLHCIGFADDRRRVAASGRKFSRPSVLLTTDGLEMCAEYSSNKLLDMHSSTQTITSMRRQSFVRRNCRWSRDPGHVTHPARCQVSLFN